MRTLDKAGMAHRAEELTRLAVGLAVKARADATVGDGPAAAPVSEDDIFIAGSIAPVEDCYSPELSPAEELAKAEHSVMAGTLADAGADILLVETMNNGAEAAGAVRAAKETDLPVLVSFTLSPDGRVLGGDRLEDVVRRMEELGVSAVLLNCFPARDMDTRVAGLMEMTSLPTGAYANMGIPDDVEGWESKGVLTPGEYAEHVAGWVRAGARLVGGCCGTGPEHIAKLHEMLQDRSG
jgi:S-methylmethionine-dependent homocysteine/selenocysteine methylase